MRRLLAVSGYTAVLLLALIETVRVVQETRTVTSIAFFYSIVFLLSGLGVVGLLFRFAWARKFVFYWNWFLLCSSFLMVWLDVLPEFRCSAVLFLVFATAAVMTHA